MTDQLSDDWSTAVGVRNRGRMHGVAALPRHIADHDSRHCYANTRIGRIARRRRMPYACGDGVAAFPRHIAVRARLINIDIVAFDRDCYGCSDPRRAPRVALPRRIAASLCSRHVTALRHRGFAVQPFHHVTAVCAALLHRGFAVQPGVAAPEAPPARPRQPRH